MKKIYITHIGKPFLFDSYLGQSTKIALMSISIRPTWPNIYSNNDFVIRKVGTNINKNVIRIQIINGLYRIEDIAAHISEEVNEKVIVFILRNGTCRLRVDEEFAAVIN